MVQLDAPMPVLAAAVVTFMELPVAFAVAVGAFARPSSLRRNLCHAAFAPGSKSICCPTYSRERRNAISEWEASMNQIQVEQKSFQMPPQDGFTVAHFLTVADIERSARFYETVFGGRILSRGDSGGAPGYIQIAEHLAHCQRRGRSDTRQTIGNPQRPRRSRFSQQLYEYPRCRYSGVL
jgi:hypothetical protein